MIQPNLKKLLKHMEEINASKVEIYSKGKKIVIDNPKVFRINMMGQEVFQITGNVREEEEINEEDIKLIMEKTGRDRETVIKKLKENEGDIAKTIVDLT